MNNQQLSYNELLSKYNDLQSRVKRFSVIQQELINVRDQLDSELELYKRKQHFTQKALLCRNQNEFINILVESVVDILEVECAVILIKATPNLSNWELHSEGINIPTEQVDYFKSHLLKISNSKQDSKSHLLHPEDFSDYQFENKIDNGVGFFALYNQFSFAIFGLNTAKKKLTYNPLNTKHKIIFDIIGRQSQIIFTNFSQSEKIEIAKLELQKLSLIATKTSNNVIITDKFGQIEWVNDAFTDTTGFTLNEVLGKKPKDFLQSKKNKKEDLDLLSQSLANKKHIEIVLLNVTKSGKKYYNNLQITPIFNTLGEHTNFISVQKDITNEINQKKEIEKIRDFFGRILENSPNSTCVIDNKGKIIYYNRTELSSQNEIIFQINQNINNYLKSDLPNCDYFKLLSSFMKAASDENKIKQFEYKTNTNESKTFLTSIKPYISAGTKDFNYIVSLTDITQLKEYESEILSTNEDLKKANSELDNFVYSVSHDLRSPLLSIKGIINLIFDLHEIDPDIDNYLHLVINSIDRLDNTIQDILEYSRNSRKSLEIEYFNIEEIVKNIYEDIKFSTDKHINFSINTNGNPFVSSDKARCNTILKNIISNAVKYRRNDIDNPSVSFELKQTPQTITFIITDNGEGISQDKLQKVFEMFYRASNQSYGTGLGLYIVKEMVDKMKGEITLNSEINVGTTITVHIPTVN